MELKKIIGSNLKYIRYKSGLSQEKFYEMYHMNPKYLASIERGEINITVNFLQNLANTLDVNIYDLLEYNNKKIITSKRIDSKK